eukprot:symbB.v1.2.000908.t1/scaffold27.1/size414596/16
MVRDFLFQRVCPELDFKEVNEVIAMGSDHTNALSISPAEQFKLPLLGPSHQFGFLHRLDVPSSGLILVARTHQAFYDLQLQLSSGTLQRDYMVLCHGWVSDLRREIRAKVHWWNAPSAVLSCGRASTSYLKRMAHFSVASCTSSLLMIRIGTGRRHQIRLHCAHMGHVVVTDSKYAALDLYRLDTEWCPRNFLHRFSLTFCTGAEEMSAIEALPADLSAVLKVTRNGKTFMQIVKRTRAANGQVREEVSEVPVEMR